MASFTDKAWDGSASRFPDTDSYCASCLIDTNPSGEKKTQENCKLTVAEPDGTVNTNALPAALAALNGARGGIKGVSAQDKKAAARKLLAYYRGAKMDVPDSLKNLAQ